MSTYQFGSDGDWSAFLREVEKAAEHFKPVDYEALVEKQIASSRASTYPVPTAPLSPAPWHRWLKGTAKVQDAGWWHVKADLWDAVRTVLRLAIWGPR